MPCSDGQQNQTHTIYRSGISPNEMAKAKAKIVKLEGALCALFNELERREIAGEVVMEASKSGECNLTEFWDKHSKSDESRIAKLISGISLDERGILRKLLNKIR